MGIPGCLSLALILGIWKESAQNVKDLKARADADKQQMLLQQRLSEEDTKLVEQRSKIAELKSTNDEIQGRLTDVRGLLTDTKTTLTYTRNDLSAQALTSLITTLSASDKYVHEIRLLLPLKATPPSDRSLKAVVLKGMNQTSWDQPSCFTSDSPLSQSDGAASLLLAGSAEVLGAQASPNNENRLFSQKLWHVKGEWYLRQTRGLTSPSEFFISTRLLIPSPQGKPAGSVLAQLQSSLVSFVLRGPCVRRPLKDISSLFDKGICIIVLNKASEETISFTVQAQPLLVEDGYARLGFLIDSPFEYSAISIQELDKEMPPDGILD